MEGVMTVPNVYWCAICDQVIDDGEPHTDPATGEDVHEQCCPVCTP